MVEFVTQEIFLKQIAAGADCVMLGSLRRNERVSWRNYYFEGRKFKSYVEWVL
jgi:hypothetical protein